ncbi:MAG: carbohydrate kinase [Treponemataceae bacterium]|nr:carbohydrate kinase [Treponemataceae bacterium]
MIVCCGEALIDMVPGKDNEGNPVYRPIPGGSPYNTAIAIGRLGSPVAFVGRLSRDFFGELLMNRLVQNGVATPFIRRGEQHSTLAFVQLETGKEPQYAFYTEGTADTSLAPEDLPQNLPSNVRCIQCGSISMLLTPISSTIERFIKQSKAQDSTLVISFDPNVRPMLIHNREAYISKVESWCRMSGIIKISDADLSYLYPTLNREQAIDRILGFGPSVVVVTLGKEGSLAKLRRTDGTLISCQVPTVEVPVADTIGAGDTFHGAFLAWLERRGKLSTLILPTLSQEELMETLSFANLAASLVCTRHGAEPPTMAELQAFKAKNSVAE